jgi:hypothetical protein
LAKLLLQDLRRELSAELALITGGRKATEPRIRQWTAGVSSYDGDSSRYSTGRGTWQPLNSNGQGYRWDQGMNAYSSFTWEGSLGSDAWISLTPRIDWSEQNGTEASLPSGYLKLRSGNTEFLLGKDAMAWGQGKMGNLLLSDNATPLPRIQISNIEPLHYRGLLRHLGAIHAKMFVAALEDRRYWQGGTWRDIDRPGLYGMRLDFQPAPDFTFGLGYTSMFGGVGVKMGLNEYLFMLLGKTNYVGNDFANGIAGVDFRWRLPSWNGAQIYGSFYSEDNIDQNEWGRHPNVVGLLGGLYIPRLSPSGDWELNLEVASTGQSWYLGGIYPGGHTYGGQILGDPMGGDANRYSVKLTHYLGAKTQIGLRFDRINQGLSQAVQQQTNALSLSMRYRLSQDVLMEFSGGLASRDNADFVSGRSKRNKFIGCSISQRF